MLRKTITWPHKEMDTVRLIYVLCMTEDNNFIFLLLILWAVLNLANFPKTLSVFEFQLSSSETTLCFMSFKNSPFAQCTSAANSVFIIQLTNTEFV
jgi:hypothetical protein